MQTVSEIEIYIHIPFCVKKCSYCDFLSAPANEETIDRYVDRLLLEVKAKSLSRGFVVTSIFVGGGTPTILSSRRLAEILETVKESYNVADDAEITLECNPGTADYNKLLYCRQAGYNRISIGLQSAVNDELIKIGRIHTFEQFLLVYDDAVRAGFTNINVDLISALPDQSLEKLDESIEKILSLEPRPQHISAYSLIIEESTVFGDMYDKGLLNLPDEDTERKMHWRVFDRFAQEGYIQYELSNMALEGYECRHNIGYWIRKDYLGFGIGAASLFQNRRYTNTRNLNEYIDGVNTLFEDYVLSDNDVMEEFMFLGLRMTKGVSKADFCEKFAKNIEEVYADTINKNVNNGLLVLDKKGRLYLTKKGQDVANYVFEGFLLDN